MGKVNDNLYSDSDIEEGENISSCSCRGTIGFLSTEVLLGIALAASAANPVGVAFIAAAMVAVALYTADSVFFDGKYSEKLANKGGDLVNRVATSFGKCLESFFGSKSSEDAVNPEAIKP